MSRQKNEPPNRYEVQDEYVLGEIRARFAYGKREDRLRLLAEVYKAKALPYELAAVVVADPDPLVRQWLARNAHSLDLREANRQRTGEESQENGERYLYPDRDLWQRLAEDPEPSVRAALYENPHYPGCEPRRFSEVENWLVGLPQECRLALMRNPQMQTFGLRELGLKIFDQEDPSLVLPARERDELGPAQKLPDYCAAGDRQTTRGMIYGGDGKRDRDSKEMGRAVSDPRRT